MRSPRLILSALPICSTLVLVGCSGTNPSPFSAGREPSVVVQATGAYRFSPEWVTVSPGQAVTWINMDSDLHGVVVDRSKGAAAGPDSRKIYPNGFAAGQRFTWTVPSYIPSGTDIAIKCPYHVGMVFLIQVR